MSGLEFVAAYIGMISLFAGSVTAPFWLGHVRSRIPVRPGPIVALVIEMLGSPRGWSFDRHYARHDTGVSMWIANGASSLGLSTTGTVDPHSMGGGNVKVSIRERHLLFRAVTQCRSSIAAEKLENELVAWSERVSRYADNVVKMERQA